MKYVAIVKTIRDLETLRDDQLNLPDLYPVDMKEFEAETLEEAQGMFPGKKVMPADLYRDGYHVALKDLYEQAQIVAEKPWWKLW